MSDRLGTHQKTIERKDYGYLVTRTTMEATAERIEKRDKKYHTGGQRFLSKIVNGDGTLR